MRVFCILLFSSIFFNALTSQKSKIHAVTFVAPPSPFSDNAMEQIKEIGFNHICIVPYGFIKKGGSEIFHNLEWQWWGEKKEGVVATIQSANKHMLKTILKPQIWMHGKWVGDLDYLDENELCKWKESYESFIFEYLDIAVENNVDIFCIGTEFRLLAKNYPDFWETLILQIREKYTGKITYSANWDDYMQPVFWDKLDFIGISAYFPIKESKDPSYNELVSQWKIEKNNIKKHSDKFQKPVLFTEYGYLSVNGCAGKTWELEKRIEELQINESCQANAIKALWDSFNNETYWEGGVLWKWFPDNMGHEGYYDKDYTPQGKIAQKVIKQIK